MSLNYGEVREKQIATLADQRARVRRYFTNSNALESVLADIAEGTKVTDIAQRLNVEYQALYAVLSGTYREQYRAARAAFAEILAEKNLEVADKIESLQMPHDAGKAAVAIRQWHMEKTAGEQWGQKSSMEINHKGVVGLHLEAIRQLADEPLEGEYVEVEDGSDRVSAGDSDSDDDAVLDSDSLDDHPLL